MKILFYLYILFLLTSCSRPGLEVINSCISNGYYVDATSGNDSSIGTSSCSPWKTLNKVENSTFTSEATIYLKRGESWNEGFVFPGSNLSISAYGSGELPIVNGSEEISSWVSEGSSIFSFQTSLASGEGLGNISSNDNILSFLAWSTDFSTTLASASMDSYTYNNSTGKLYVKVSTDPSGNGYRYSKIYRGFSADSLTNINISNVEVLQFSLHGIEFKNCTNCNATNVVVTNTGGATIGALYAGNGIEYGNSSSNGTIDNATISNIFDSCFSPQTFSNSQVISSISFKNSTVSKCGFAGIEISVLSNGGSTGSSISGVSVSNVSISDTGSGWSGRRYGTEGYGIRVQADSGAGSISGTTIDQVSISGSIGDGIKINGNTGETTISKSKIYSGSLVGLNFIEATSTTPKLILNTTLIYNNGNYGLSYNCPNCAGLNLYHNTFYDNSAINIAIFNQSNEGLIKNNIFYSSSAMTHLFVNSTLTGADIDYNCYNDTTNMFGYNGSTYSSVTALNGALAFEVNGIGNGTVNLTDAVGSDFSLTSSSACRSLGVTGLSISTDISGNSFSSPPSSGAYEY